MSRHPELAGLIDRVLAFEPRIVTPHHPPVLYVDGVRHDPGDATVLRRAEVLRGFLPWRLGCTGADAARILRVVPNLSVGAAGRPGRAEVAHLLEALRGLLLHAGRGSPRFALSTIDRVEVIGAQSVLLSGTCALILPGASTAPTAAV